MKNASVRWEQSIPAMTQTFPLGIGGFRDPQIKCFSYKGHMCMAGGVVQRLGES